MSGPPMTRRRATLAVVLGLWLAVTLYSLWVLTMIAPTGDGFTRGMNRVTGFLGWQLAAAVLAVVAWRAGRAFPKRSPLWWLSRGPLVWAAGLVLGILALILWARLSHP